MRLNLPVTNVEYRLKENEYIVSKTDLKGRITYTNRPFVDISGFTDEGVDRRRPQHRAPSRHARGRLPGPLGHAPQR